MFNNQKIITSRIFDLFPGGLVWLTFILSIILSFTAPIYVIYFIIIFDLYWLLKVIYLAVHLLVSWSKYKKIQKINWWEKVTNFPGKNWRQYYHLIFLPTYKEPLAVIERAFDCLINSNYDTRQFIVILGGEERDKENFLKIAENIKEKYFQKFFRMLITVHPKDVLGELAGKGSNMNFMGRSALVLIDQLKLPYDKIIVSAFDVDTCATPQYFANLTYQYFSHPRPTRTSYQPLTVYHNNIWESDPVTRVVAISTTFWLLTDLSRHERLFTFSSHSMSFQALVDVGFWQNDIVSEDSRIFLQCLIHYDGDYEVTPIFIPVSMNTVAMGNFWRSLLNQYKQMRRWGWGCEHFPYLVKNFWRNKKISLVKKLRFLWYQTEGMYSWATAPILIFLLGRLPLWVMDVKQHQSVITLNAPTVLKWIMTGAMIGLILSAVLSTLMMPAKPKHLKNWHYLLNVLQWLLFPVTSIIFGSLPAIDAQTRLMLGGKFRLGFWVTEKK